MPRQLLLVLGDQISSNLSCLHGLDTKSDTALWAEVMEDASLSVMRVEDERQQQAISQRLREWHLALYIDFSLGVIMPAYGGYLAFKPYNASGHYIKLMSYFCRGCDSK